MMTLTHLTAGAIAAAGILQTDNPVLIGVGAIASLLPDVDLSVSPAGRVLFFISWWLERHFPHRGPTHSIFVCAICTAITYAGCYFTGYSPLIAIAFGLGYFLGGIFPDCFTKSGAAIFWPLDSLPWWCPDNYRYRLSTGSRGEWILLTGLVVTMLIIFSINNKGGIELQFGQLLGSTSGVEQVYNRYGSTNLIDIQVDGVRAIDRTPVKSAFTLIQQHGLGFLVEDSQGNILKAGTEPDSQLISSRITAKQGRKASVIIKPLTITDTAIAQPLASEYQSYPSDKIYLTGDLSLDDEEDVPAIPTSQYFPVISKSGTSIKMEACPIAVGYSYLREAWGSGTLQVRVVHLNE